MRLRNTLIAGAFLAALPFAGASADPYTSPYDNGSGPSYVGLRGSIVEDTDTHTTASATDLRAHYGTGFGGSIYAGMPLGYGFRVEGELLYRHNTLESLNVAGVPAAGRNGYQQIAAPMANLYWTLPLDSFIARPFIGGGVGAAYVDTHDRIGALEVIRSDKWHFAYQLMAGVVVPLSQTSRLTGMYRYFRVQDADYRCTPPALPTTACRATTMNQSIDLGIEFDI